MHRIQGSSDPRIQGSLDPRLQGSLDPRIQGSLDPRIQVSLYRILGSWHLQTIFHLRFSKFYGYKLCLIYRVSHPNIFFSEFKPQFQIQSPYVKLHKSNKCEYTFAHKVNMRRSKKPYDRVKSHKCSQCNYASSRADVLRSLINATSVVIRFPMRTRRWGKGFKCKICPSKNSKEWKKMHKCNQCEYGQPIKPS